MFSDPVVRCLDDRLTPFYAKSTEFNALIQHYSKLDDESGSLAPINQRFIPYIGNGWFGLEVEMQAKLHVKYGRYLSQAVNYLPIVSLLDQQNSLEDSAGQSEAKDSIVVDYVNGIVHQFQCFSGDFFVSHSFYGKYFECTYFLFFLVW